MDHAKKNDLFRTSPTHSLGSSGQSSPVDDVGQEITQNYQYRSLAYLPGSVHGGASFGHVQQPQQLQQQGQQQIALVKQEPTDHESRNHYGRGPGSVPQQQQTILPVNNNQQYSNSTVSSTTNGMQAMAAYVINGTSLSNTILSNNVNNNNNNNNNNNINNNNNSQSCQTPLPLLKSFATPPRYLLPHTTNPTGGSKKRMDRGTDEYRKRRERNNVAVRKSREKAKIRSKETEERVKILARENDRLQKKTELLQEELSVLRSLFSNVGVLPEHIHRELAKHMENFQQQHNAMGCM